MSSPQRPPHNPTGYEPTGRKVAGSQMLKGDQAGPTPNGIEGSCRVHVGKQALGSLAAGASAGDN